MGQGSDKKGNQQVTRPCSTKNTVKNKNGISVPVFTKEHFKKPS